MLRTRVPKSTRKQWNVAKCGNCLRIGMRAQNAVSKHLPCALSTALYWGAKIHSKNTSQLAGLFGGNYSLVGSLICNYQLLIVNRAMVGVSKLVLRSR